VNSKHIVLALAFPLFLVSVATSAAEEGRWIEPRCTVMPCPDAGALVFVVLGDGSLMTVQGGKTCISKDDGNTWSEPKEIYDGPGPGIPSDACVLLRTREGVLVLVYMDMSVRKWQWDSVQHDCPDARLDVWAIRSVDEGKTWVDRQRLLEGYCGALIDIIQTSEGEIVVPVQQMLHNPGRHAIRSHVSADGGKTWRQGNIIDLGGCGHHDGAMEPTLAELSDGRLLMLIRTNLGQFWEAYSTDRGRYWRVLRPSQIDASSAPGYLLRLTSGRLALVWNRLSPQEGTGYPRVGGKGQTSEIPASWHRQELSLAFSGDDGQTWTEPVVIAREKGKQLSYPYMFERVPGQLWVVTRYNRPQNTPPVCIHLREADFVGR
jgi:hypothetical protein